MRGTGRRGRTIVVAPDSFKGTITASAAAAAIATGWRAQRPDDEIVLLPLADGGEGTVEALAAGVDAERRAATVPGLDGAPLQAPWLELADGRAVVELAAVCGLPMLDRRDPLGAHTGPLGAMIAAVLDAGATGVLVGLGGSASTDGGTGALRELGARFLDDAGHELPRGGGALIRLASVHLDGLRAAPPLGVDLLTDVSNPMLGPSGAAAVFGPQKGASPAEVALLEAGLGRLRELLGGPDLPGAGAAGATAYGLVTAWGARIVPGAERILDALGARDAVAGADAVVTGEGSFDAQSLQGKLVGTVLELCRSQRVPVVVVAGRVDRAAAGSVTTVSLTELAGSAAAAMADPARWLAGAGRAVASIELPPR